MENFTNETINTANLPKFEEVAFTALHADYWKVILVTWLILLGILAIGVGAAISFIDEFSDAALKLSLSVLTVMGVVLLFSRLAFKKKAFAFRNHDVLFRHGVIATTTIVIPYNRVQHVSLHEGFVSRIFGLAQVEIFTAGGSSSDITIPGIAKEEAENIKQLLMGKIQKQL